MKRFLLSALIALAFSQTSHAAHIIGGEMRYTYISAGTGPNTRLYRITLILFRGDDPTGATFAPNYPVGVFNNDNGQKVIGTAVNNNWLVDQTSISSIPIIFPSCIQNAPVLNYTYAIYTMNIELPVNLSGYTVAYQTCCRINGLMNVANSTGSTYSCVIPGTNQLGASGTDSSPMFGLPINVICKNAPFTLNFNAVDSDPGDSLVYSLCDALNGGAAVNAGFNDPAPPPYGFVNYLIPYSGANPFGTNATINSQTGIISGMAPDFGKYVVCVCIAVYRNGIQIATHKKDLIVQVSDCSLTVANPMPDFTTCDGFTLQFSHTSSGANTVFWDFGVLALANDTSNIDNPIYTFPDTGLYKVKFVINRGTGCADSVIRNIGVYPGFFPGFTITGNCFSNPFQFTDTTNTRYGVVNSWIWNFGDAATLADTSRIRNPQWIYPSAGPRTVQLIVTNSKGCIDTAQTIINVLDKPPLSLAFRDTLICRNDPGVQLNATGTGTFNWTPGASIISGANTATPIVSPANTTWYYVNLIDNGCSNRDSVQVRVVAAVSLQASNDTTICQGDQVQLNAVSDGLSYSWSPTAGLNNPNIINPIATVNTTTIYSVTASVGSCRASDQVTIRTVPYPVANVGPDKIVCYNGSTQLNAVHDGSSFTWTPVNYLSSPNVLSPFATPPRTTQYIFSSFDTRGCPKPGRDTILVTILPKVRAFAGRDTSVVISQPLQFNGSGGMTYVWSPSTGLSNPNIFNPVGTYTSANDSIRYKLTVADAAGCVDSAFIIVRIYQVKPTIFVPTAFTPNNDGLNDVVRPICVGIQKINYFSVYNRWGQLVFKTEIDRAGWDGRINGRLQNSAVFVWMVSAVDYQGNPIFLKGTVALIR